MGIFLIMIVIVMIIVSLAIYLFKKGIIHSKVLVIVGSVLGGTALFVWVAMFFNFHSVSLINESLGHFKIGEKFEGVILLRRILNSLILNRGSIWKKKIKIL